MSEQMVTGGQRVDGPTAETQLDSQGSSRGETPRPSTICSLAIIALVRESRDLPGAVTRAELDRAIGSVAKVADDFVLVLDERSDSVTVDDSSPLRIFRRPFVSFSDQRNFAAQLCRGEWVLVLDADDWFKDLGDLRACMEQAPTDIDIIDCTEFTIDEAGHEIEQGTAIVAYRRRVCSWKYHGHNTLVGYGPNRLRSDAVMMYRHPRNVADAKARAQRTIPLLMLDLKENPADPHAPFFLARASWLGGDAAGMQKWARVCIGLAPTSVPHSPAFVMEAMATMQLGGLEAAEDVVNRGLAIHPAMPDLHYLKATIALARWNLALTKQDNPYLACHLTTDQWLKPFLDVSATFGMPFKRRAA